MAGKKGQSGPEAKWWAKAYRRPKGEAIVVSIPVRLIREAGLDPDVPLLVRRRSGKDRGAIFLQFRPASEIPEGERA